ncbi:high light inducible protein [Gracilaria domingensis]|nr:high light inducible protein [Gracilaria domingensis]
MRASYSYRPSALVTEEMSPRAASCPRIPFPVMASVAIASTSPSMAARPLRTSEKAVKPWGIFSFSAIMTTADRRAGAAIRRRDVKDVTETLGVVRAKTGVAETKAVEAIVLKKR